MLKMLLIAIFNARINKNDNLDKIFYKMHAYITTVTKHIKSKHSQHYLTANTEQTFYLVLDIVM